MVPKLSETSSTGRHLNVSALDVSELVHRYGENEALKSVSFRVDMGTSFALLGPNGSGKTTLFRIASTLLRPTSGTVRVCGEDVQGSANSVRRNLGVMFQSPALDSRLTVKENLRHHGRLYGISGDTLSTRIAELLHLIHVDDRANALVGTLSGGLQRRVELAKALLPAPTVLLLDEPSTGIDPGARRDVSKHLQTLRRTKGTTIVVNTHLMEEASECDVVGILHKGHLVACGPPALLTANLGDDIIFVSSQNLETLASRIKARFDTRVDIVENRLRLQQPRAHEFIPELVEAFPGEIDAITFGKPTLEDVFMHHTGQALH